MDEQTDGKNDRDNKTKGTLVEKTSKNQILVNN